MPDNWETSVDELQTEAELAAIDHSALRGSPYGGDQWLSQVATRLGMEAARRPRGRPGKYLT